MIGKKKMELDPLSDEGLAMMLESFKWEWITRWPNDALEIYRVKDVDRLHGRLKAQFIVNALKNPIELNGYKYRLSWGLIERRGPKVRKATQSKLKYHVEKVLVDAKEMLK